jgi:hypothetical protein
MDRVVYFVVRDTKLDAGDGIVVKDLEELKQRLLALRPKGEWRLVVSIHGAENVISARGGNLKNPDAEGVYDAEDIKRLFADDAEFRKWRDAHGPAWTTLNACQVHKQFEAAIIQAFNKSTATQNAQGLGKGCRPATVTMSYTRPGGGQEVTTWSQWRRLPKGEQRELEAMMSELNKKVGYFGGPPVDESLLLHYYFDEEPKGGWPVVTVSVDYADTGISFHNRTQNARFLSEKCKDHLGPMRSRKATAPPAP